MRLDHLLSKEEEVGDWNVLFCYQGALPEEQRERPGIYSRSGPEARTDWASDSSEKKRSGFERVRRTRNSAELNNRNFPVAMRLGETPVPIPNTMVKT